MNWKWSEKINVHTICMSLTESRQLQKIYYGKVIY